MAVNVTITSSYIIEDFYNRSGGGDIYVYSSGGSGTGSSGGGATSLASLSDVALTALSNNQVLTYNLATNKWVNKGPVLAEASLGSDFYWNAGLLNVSTGIARLSYVDGSLNTLKAYVTDLSTRTSYWKTYTDGSLARFIRSSSTGDGLIWNNGYIDVSIILNKIKDVSITDASNNQVLQFKSAYDKWINRNPIPLEDYVYLKGEIDASWYTKTQIDSSFALKTDIPSGVVKEASLGPELVWVGGLLDVSIVTKDASVNALYAYVNDLSTNTSYWKTYTDGSLNTLKTYVTDLSTKTQNFINNSSLGTDFYWASGKLEVSTALSLLNEVSISNINDAQALQYDADNSIWVNQDTLVAEDYFATRSEIDYLATTNPSIGTYFDAFFNTWVGSDALKDVSQGGTYAGTGNTAIGYRALYVDTSGYQNTAVGRQAMYANTYGVYNDAFGAYALYSNTIGSYNSGLGRTSLYSNISGERNVAVGYQALYYNTTGSYNTAVGFQALRMNIAGQNTAVGYLALYSVSEGNYNTAVGQNALQLNYSHRNTAIGYGALGNSTSAYGNIGIGFYGGRYRGSGTDLFTTGNYNIYLGYQARASANGATNEIVIGYDAIGAGSNTVTLGNTSCVSTYLRGTLYADGSAGYTGSVVAGQTMTFKNGILVQVV